MLFPIYGCKEAPANQDTGEITGECTNPPSLRAASSTKQPNSPRGFGVKTPSSSCAPEQTAALVNHSLFLRPASSF